MVDGLLFVVVVLAAGCVAAAGFVFGVLHALAVRNRVVPGHRSPAPLSWLTSPDGAARLHRRLRRAMAAAASASPASASSRGDDLGLGDVVAQLRAHALELDEQLVFASRTPRAARRRMLRELHTEISELELLVQRTVRMRRAWDGSAPSERGLAPVRQRLELLESALRELDGIEVTPTSERARLPRASQA